MSYSPYQIAVADERATAHGALVVLAGRVRAYVHGKLRLAGECHRTAIAAERLLRHVRPSAAGSGGGGGGDRFKSLPSLAQNTHTCGQ